MSNDDASELRLIATQAQARKTAKDKKIAEQNAAVIAAALLHAAETAKWEQSIEATLRSCLDAAIACTSSIQSPLLSKHSVKRLSDFGLLVITVPSKTSAKTAELQKEAAEIMDQCWHGIESIKVTINRFPSLSGLNQPYFSKLNSMAASLRPDNMLIVFNEIQAIAIEQAYHSQEAAKVLVERDHAAVAEVQNALLTCDKTIERNQNRILLANRQPSVEGLTRLRQLMASGLPTVADLKPTPEFLEYFSETVYMLLKGNHELESTERWHTMTRDLVEADEIVKLEQIEELQLCAKQLADGFSERHKLSPHEIVTLKQEIQEIKSFRRPALEKEVEQTVELCDVSSALQAKANDWVETLPIVLGRYSRNVYNLYRRIHDNGSEIQQLAGYPLKESQISWSLAPNSIPPSSSAFPSFADLLRFISGQEWDDMYSNIKGIAKRAAIAGGNACDISFEYQGDGYMRLHLGKKSPSIPAMPVKEFCKILEQRSKMVCSWIPARQNQLAAIHLTW